MKAGGTMNMEEFGAELLRIKQSANPLIEVEKIQNFLRLEDTEWSAAALAYVSLFVLPTLSGIDCANRALPFSVYMRLFRDRVQDKPSEWEKWIELFPDTVVEVREDKEHGQTLLLGLPFKPEWALERKAGVFYSPNGFNIGPSAGHKSRRSIDNVKRFNAVWADFDVGEDGKEDAISQIVKLPITPSVVVETRNGFHVIYRLGGSWTLQEWQSVQNGLIDATGSDKACKDASRLLRVPGSWHCKDVWKGGEPYFVKVVWLVSSEYDVKTLSGAFAKPPEKPQNGFQGQERPRWDNVRVPRLATLPAGQRHGTLLEEAGRIYANLDVAQARNAREMLKEWYQRSSQPLKQGWEREAEMVSDWMEQREFGQVISR